MSRQAKLWAAYEATEQYWYWGGQTTGQDRLLNAVADLLLGRSVRKVRGREPRQRMRNCAWW